MPNNDKEVIYVQAPAQQDSMQQMMSMCMTIMPMIIMRDMMKSLF